MTGHRPIPRDAVTDADTERQRRLLNTAVRSCIVVIEYVDGNLGLSEARDEVSGVRVSLTWKTVGVDFGALAVGSRLLVEVTALNYAVAARPA